MNNNEFKSRVKICNSFRMNKRISLTEKSILLRMHVSINKKELSQTECFYDQKELKLAVDHDFETEHGQDTSRGEQQNSFA